MSRRLRGIPIVVTSSGEESREVAVAESGGTDARDVSPWHRHPLVAGVIVALAAVNLRPAVASVGAGELAPVDGVLA